MSPSSSVKIGVFFILLFALTLASVRVLRGGSSSSEMVMESSVLRAELTVPVVIIEVGEDPALLEVRVQP
ncbi:hypothetical protein [Haloferula sp.]|uniref:hypothetical protein n=1 Tax=Haloferula sp. TaxID=2497595 RepID=UPI003C70F51E